jgi:chromosome segregation ATPase
MSSCRIARGKRKGDFNMEEMNLAKLEAVVEKMLKHIQELKRENASLQAQVEDKNNTIVDLEAQLSSVTSNQDEVGKRVTNLLSSIEEWEKSVDLETLDDHQEVAEEAEEAEEPMEPREANLFSIAD